MFGVPAFLIRNHALDAGGNLLHLHDDFADRFHGLGGAGNFTGDRGNVALDAADGVGGFLRQIPDFISDNAKAASSITRVGGLDFCIDG